MEFSAVKVIQRQGGEPETTRLGAFPSLESAMRAALADPDVARMTPVDDWDPSDNPPGIRRIYRDDDGGLLLVTVSEQPETPPGSPAPPVGGGLRDFARAAVERNQRRQVGWQQDRDRGKQLWVVQSGGSTVLHLMWSRSPGTPSYVSAYLLLGAVKTTLCGKHATRHVEVFEPREVTCRECKRRAGFG